MTSIASRTRSPSPELPRLVNDTLITKRQWLALGVMCFTVLLISLDQTVLNIALPTLVRSLHPSSSGLQWIADSYTLTNAVLLLFGGALGDRYGRRRLFIVGVAVFGAGSAACALVHSTGPLIGGPCRHGTRGRVLDAGNVVAHCVHILRAQSGPGHRHLGRRGRHRRLGRAPPRRLAPAALLVGLRLPHQRAGSRPGPPRWSFRGDREPCRQPPPGSIRWESCSPLWG